MDDITKTYYEYYVVRPKKEILVWRMPSGSKTTIIVNYDDTFDTIGAFLPRHVVETALDYLGHDLDPSASV